MYFSSINPHLQQRALRRWPLLDWTIYLLNPVNPPYPPSRRGIRVIAETGHHSRRINRRHDEALTTLFGIIPPA
jgi:hypothetical protein